MTALMFTACLADQAPPRRGPFAFHYGPRLTEEGIAWYSQFDLLVTHDPLPRDQIDRLHAAGTRLLVYEWSVAFYESRATEWQRSLLSRGEGLLNRTPLTGGVGSTIASAWYFDVATETHRMQRADDIARRLRRIGYDGVFFDTTTIENVHPEARKEYERRHPDTPYDVAFSRFLIQLRRKLPRGVLFTNQGYRSAEHYLPYVDWDLTESLITSGNRLRPWTDQADPWNSIHFVMDNAVAPIVARYPHVRFGHLNYVDGRSHDTIRLAMAVAQLFDAEAFVAAPAIADELDDIYFRTPGKPVSPRIDRPGGKAAYRLFEHGLIVVTAADQEITIDNPEHKDLRDRFTGELICGDPITLLSAAGRARAFFFDYTHCSGGR